ncbi:hypothetical protein [Microlunatus sagamiharensis]|uniref:hypothetical protein n=1 Tax=Microlunatus sagamiharensis TaxID=546874 RepID=UPI0012FE0DBA|nr:hypothetical protein [Microlunatus sagamiharensis]
MARLEYFALMAGKVNADGVREWLVRRVAPPPDPGLEVFRDAIGTLSLDGEVVGYIASRVSTFWGLGRPTGLQECLWLYFHYLDDPDGNAERSHLWEEDYPPWAIRPELESGSFYDHDRDATYEVRWLEGPARRDALDLIGLGDGVTP